MTAARHSGQYAAVPGRDEIVAMAPAAIYSCRVGDSSTQVAINQELADMGAAPDEVASTFAVMAGRCSGKPAAANPRPLLLPPAGPARSRPAQRGQLTPTTPDLLQLHFHVMGRFRLPAPPARPGPPAQAARCARCWRQALPAARRTGVRPRLRGPAAHPAAQRARHQRTRGRQPRGVPERGQSGLQDPVRDGGDAEPLVV